MYSYLEIEFICKNIKTLEEFDRLLDIIIYLFCDLNEAKFYDKDRKKHISEQINKCLKKLENA